MHIVLALLGVLIIVSVILNTSSGSLFHKTKTFPGNPSAALARENLISTATPNPNTRIKTVFIIVMENHNWSDIHNNPSAPYINHTLLPKASYALQYQNPPGIHPSEPNYLWLEAGTTLGISNDNLPGDNHQSTQDHLTAYLEKAGISWKAYQEGISGEDCPLTNQGKYTPRHNPMVFFDDVTGGSNQNSARCLAHIRPLSELKTDLRRRSVARYNFITPDLCHDMHDKTGCDTTDPIKNGDAWLSIQVPIILKSHAYRDGGLLLITWDESESGDQPIGMIVLSPFAKGGGYSNTVQYTHSSTLRTIQEIFGIQPFLGEAAKSNDLSDLFTTFP